MSDFRGVVRTHKGLRLSLAVSLLVYSLAMLAFWGVRLHADYIGTKPVFVLEAALLAVAVVGLTGQCWFIVAILRETTTWGRSVLLVLGGLALAVLAFAGLLLLGRDR